MAKKMKSGSYQIGRIIEQSGGMNNAVCPTILNENEAVLLTNVDLEEKGTVKMCKGRRERFATPFDANNPCNGITAFYPDPATSRLVFGAGTKLYSDTPHLMYDWETQEDFEAGYLCNGKYTVDGVEVRDVTTVDRSGDVLTSTGTSVVTADTGEFGWAFDITSAEILKGFRYRAKEIGEYTVTLWEESTGGKIADAVVNCTAINVWYTANLTFKPLLASGRYVVSVRIAAKARYTDVSSTFNYVTFVNGRYGVSGSMPTSTGTYLAAIVDVIFESRTIPTIPTFTRASDKYASDGTVAGVNAPIFANGVHMEEGTTNLVSNSDVEINTDGWTTATYAGSGNFTHDGIGYGSSKSLKIASTADGSRLTWITPAVTLTESTTYTVSVWVKVSGLTAGGVVMTTIPNHLDRGDVYNKFAILAIGNTDWVRVSSTITVAEGQGGNFNIRLWAELVNNGAEVWFDRIQAEQKAYATSYHPTTRQPDGLYYTQTIPDEWFISGTWIPDQGSTISRANVMVLAQLHYTNTNRYFISYLPSSDKFWFYKNYGTAVDLYTDEVVFSAGDTINWAACQLTQDYGDLAAGMHLWYKIGDGAVVHVSNTDTNLPTKATKAYIGCSTSAGYEANGGIDSVKITDIKAAYARGQAVSDTWAQGHFAGVTADPSTLMLCNFDDLDAENIAGYVWISDSKDISNASNGNSGKVIGVSTITGNATVAYRTSTSADNLTWDAWAVVDALGNIGSTYRDNIKLSVIGTLSGDDKPVFNSASMSYDDTPSATELAIGFTPGGQFYFAALLGKLVEFNKLDAPKKWDGTNAVGALGGSPPHSQYAMTHKNYLFSAGTSGNPSRLYWSDLLDIDTWNALSFIDISPNDGDWITGLLAYGDYLLITKQRSTWALLGSSPSDFQVIRLDDSIGCIAPRSLVKMPKGFAFVSTEGVYISDLSNPIKLTERVKVTWDSLNKRRLNTAAAIYYDNKLRVDIPSGSSTVNDTRIIFDTIRQCLYHEEFSDHASCYAKFIEAGEEILLYGHSTEGQISRADYGTTDAGAAITMAWEPKHFNFGSSLIEKKVRRTYLAVVPALSDTVINVTYIVNGVDVGTLTVTILGSSTGGETKIKLNPRDIDVRNIDVSMGYRITQTASNGGVRFHELIQEYRTGRIKV